MAQRQGRNRGQLDGSAGTVVTTANFTLGAGWGTAATFTVATGSNDRRGQLAITASTTGLAQATATVLHTFVDGAFASAAPFAFSTTTNDNSLTAASAFKATTVTTTTCLWTHSILPVDTKIYILNYWLIT